MEITQDPVAGTFFASPVRSTDGEISCEVAALSQGNSYVPLLDAMPNFVMILDRNRQIIFANQHLREFGSTCGIESVLGMRPGELLNCENAASAPSGCGTNRACETCGAVKAILEGLSGKSVVHECRVSTIGGGALDLRIWASPFVWNTDSYILVIAADISDEKRRHVLERMFFHDLLNTAGGICGLAEVLEDGLEMSDELRDALVNSARLMVNEIKSQQILLAAENDELGVSPIRLRSWAVLEAVISQLRNHDVAAGKIVGIAPESIDFDFMSDEALLSRALGNLLKNAMEASRPGDSVILGARMTAEGSVFWCNNPTVMPPHVQLQIFQRSFSTKGTGRGIGTYSVRLLTERYLKGTVTFESGKPEGTTFYITLPASTAAKNPGKEKISQLAG